MPSRRTILFGLALAGLAGGLAACTSAVDALNAVTSRGGYALERGIRYRDGERGTLDLYVPNGAGPRTPLVVFFYGGGWDSGSKNLYRFVGQSLASRGIAVAVPDYRIYPEVRFPAFVEDGAEAVAFVARAAREGAHGLPAGRHPLFLMGHSAGAQITALLALDERYLRGAGASADRLSGFIGLAGPYDFLPLKEERYKRVFPEKTRPASQAVNFVNGREPPALLLAGADDTTVNPENTRSLARRLAASGSEVESAILHDSDHIDLVSGLATALPVGARSVRERVLSFVEAHSR